jgi:hypothetical protein
VQFCAIQPSVNGSNGETADGIGSLVIAPLAFSREKRRLVIAAFRRTLVFCSKTRKNRIGEATKADSHRARPAQRGGKKE